MEFVNFDSLVDVDGPAELLPSYTECLRKITATAKRMRGHISELIGNVVLLAFLEGETKAAPQNACRSIFLIRKHVEELNRSYGAYGREGWKVAIGVHTGKVIASNELSSSYDEVKVLGQNVNVALSIRRECNKDQPETLASEVTVELLDGSWIVEKKKDLSIDLPHLFPGKSHLALYEIKGLMEPERTSRSILERFRR